MVPGASSKGHRILGRRRAEHLAAIGRFLATLHTTPHEAARQHGVEVRDLWGDVSLPRTEATIALACPLPRTSLNRPIYAHHPPVAPIHSTPMPAQLPRSHLLLPPQRPPLAHHS